MPNGPFTPEQIAQILEEFFKTVGTRQYIGSRYVPIFGRKDEDSIEWDNTGTYEPLSIVLYQGNSYTSRQYVPVGVDITNQEFWALTGNYNAQVEQYRRETALAQATANEALQTANAAEETANAAEATAESAQTAADNAQTAADNAQTAADNAQVAADRAQGAAVNAQSDVDSITEKFNDFIGSDSLDIVKVTTPHSIGYCIKIPKSEYKAVLRTNPATLIQDPDNDNRCANPATLMEYASREKPFLCVNVTNSTSFIYDDVVYGGSWVPGNTQGSLIVQNGEEIEIAPSIADYTMAQYASLYSNLATVWPYLIKDGIQNIPPYYDSYYRTNPMSMLGWNDDFYYLIMMFGRLGNSIGCTFREIMPFATANQITNLANLDGGGSSLAIFGESLEYLMPMVNTDYDWRKAALNISIVERD